MKTLIRMMQLYPSVRQVTIDQYFKYNISVLNDNGDEGDFFHLFTNHQSKDDILYLKQLSSSYTPAITQRSDNLL